MVLIYFSRGRADHPPLGDAPRRWRRVRQLWEPEEVGRIHDRRGSTDEELAIIVPGGGCSFLSFLRLIARDFDVAQLS